MHCFALILISILQTCKGCFSVAEEREIVDSTVKLTNNMTLKCVYPKMAKITQMSWIKSKGKETIAVFKLPHSLHITSIYEGRVNVINHTMNDKSLVFNNTTKADIGLYICSFQSFPHGIWEKKVQVVQAGKINGFLTVLEDMDKCKISIWVFGFALAAANSGPRILDLCAPDCRFDGCDNGEKTVDWYTCVAYRSSQAKSGIFVKWFS
uniref:Uncharacterized protein n=1 Tax=Sphaerodactylus townsendi TaxID=933632 RepID=A0ACB8FCR0_9SAUR